MHHLLFRRVAQLLALLLVSMCRCLRWQTAHGMSAVHPRLPLSLSKSMLSAFEE
jgi:hypothetical protein